MGLKTRYRFRFTDYRLRYNLRLGLWTNSLHIFYVAPKNFGDAPCLGDATARPLWRVPVQDLRDVSESTVAEVFFERLEPLHRLASCNFAAAIDLDVSGNERSHKPRPDGTLMVGTVSLCRITRVSATVLRIAWS